MCADEERFTAEFPADPGPVRYSERESEFLTTKHTKHTKGEGFNSYKRIRSSEQTSSELA